MSSPSIRTVLPLAFVTGVSMAAMDLYLPAVPALQTGLGISVPLAQATIAVYLAGLAGAALVWRYPTVQGGEETAPRPSL